MKILVVGAGGCGHALARKIAQSPKVQVVYVSPGYAAANTDPRLINLPMADPQSMAQWAVGEKIALVVVASPTAMASGMVDACRRAGLRSFGATQAAAQWGQTPGFDHAFMARHGIATAALSEGQTTRFNVLTDGKNVVALASCCNHSPGGSAVGVQSPSPLAGPAVHAKAMREVILPALKGLDKEGLAYTGFLSANLLISATGAIQTLGLACANSDVETQAIVMRLKSDLLELLWCATEGKLASANPLWDRRIALGAILPNRGPRPDGEDIVLLPSDQGDTADFWVSPSGAAASKRSDKGSVEQPVACITVLADTLRHAHSRLQAALCGLGFDAA